MIKKTKVIKYNNGVCVKTKNKRVIVDRKAVDANLLVFARLTENKRDLEIPSCRFQVIKGKVCTTSLFLSDAGIEALHLVLSEYLIGKYLSK